MAVKTPIGYYAGKTLLAKRIIDKAFPDLSEIKIFGEMFAGGAALSWHLPDSIPQFILNDNSSQVTTFYKAMKSRDPEFLQLVEQTLHSEDSFKLASRIFYNPEEESLGRVAWSCWYLSSASFAYEIGKGLAFNRSGLKGGKGVSGALYSRKASIPEFVDRIEKRNLTIFNRDFADLPDIYDEEGILWFVDPPYLGTYLGHCGQWVRRDEIRLLRYLETFEKARFVLSGYLSNEDKINFAQKNDWEVIVLKDKIRAKKSGSKTQKNEIVLRNFR